MVKEGYKEVKRGLNHYQVPNYWDVKWLNEIADYSGGSQPPKKTFVNEEKEGYVRLYQIRDYTGSQDKPAYIPEDKASKTTEKGDIIIGRYGASIGKVFLAEEGAYNVAMVKVLLEDNTNKKYMYYYFNSKIFQDRLNIGVRAAQSGFNKDDWATFSVPLPPLPEQKKIASILSSVDKSIEKTDEIIEETKELKKGLMQELLTKGIGHSEFKEVRIGTKKTKIPQKWDIFNLEELVDLRNGKFNPTKNLSDNYDIPVYGGNGITGYYNEPLIEEPTIVIGRVGEYCGSIHLVKEKTWVTDNAIYINKVNDKNNIYLDYLALYLKFANLNNLSNRTGQPKLTQSRILTVGIPFPPLEEQKKIAAILSSVDSKIQKEEEYKAKLERLKKGLMQKLLTGEIRVNTEMEV